LVNVKSFLPYYGGKGVTPTFLKAISEQGEIQFRI
jgi:hypothetical protein